MERAVPRTGSPCPGYSWSELRRYAFVELLPLHISHLALFIGFYYVCVEFDPRPELSPSMSQTSSYDSSLGPCIESGFAPGPYPAVVADPASDRWRSCAEPRAPAPATMTGFYFHQNSEPYQQLSLTHVPKRFHSSCEFR